jgi:hypothetical protein
MKEDQVKNLQAPPITGKGFSFMTFTGTPNPESAFVFKLTPKCFSLPVHGDE